MPSKMALGQLAILKQKHKEKQKQNQKWSHNGLDQNIIAESENHLEEIIRENYAIRLNIDFLDTLPKSRFSKKKKGISWKCKTLVPQKILLKKEKTSHIKKKIHAYHISDKEFVSKTSKFLKLGKANTIKNHTSHEEFVSKT